MDMKPIFEASKDSKNRKWRHELDHDAESIWWLIFYWAITAQPKGEEKEPINHSAWSTLTGSADERHVLIQGLSAGSLSDGIHSAYELLFPLLCDLASILLVDRHWLDDSEARNKPEYITEAFQRLILQFVLDNGKKPFMEYEVDEKPRRVDQVSHEPSMSPTHSSLEVE
jgi:hypothetical protein